jgi:hypothetical protein
MTLQKFRADQAGSSLRTDKKREPLKATLQFQKIKTPVPGMYGYGGRLCEQVINIGADFMQSANSVKGFAQPQKQNINSDIL